MFNTIECSTLLEKFCSITWRESKGGHGNLKFIITSLKKIHGEINKIEDSNKHLTDLFTQKTIKSILFGQVDGQFAHRSVIFITFYLRKIKIKKKIKV